MRLATAVSLALASLVVASPAGHGHGHGIARDYGHAHAHGLEHRAIQVETVTVTTVIYHTVTAVDEPIALPTSASLERLIASPHWPPTNSSQVPQKETPIAPPIIAPPNPPSTFNGNPYKELVPVAGSASVVNSCNYPVYVWSINDPSCGPGKECQLVAPNTTYTETLRKCHNAGISLKVTKTKAMTDPMQFEYTVWDNASLVSYDISYLDCMKNVNGEKDLTACVGHERGIQAVGGGDCPDYHCVAGQWCDQQAYVVAEFGYQDGAPVGACSVDKGVAFELCAGNR